MTKEELALIKAFRSNGVEVSFSGPPKLQDGGEEVYSGGLLPEATVTASGTPVKLIPTKSVKSIPRKEQTFDTPTQRPVPSAEERFNYAAPNHRRILFDPNYVPPVEDSKTFYDKLVNHGQSNSQIENAYEFFDFTGMSSWDDAAAAHNQWNKSDSTYPTAGEALDMFGAVPGLGKFGNLKYLNPNAIKKAYKNIPWQKILNKGDALQDMYEDDTTKNLPTGTAPQLQEGRPEDQVYSGGLLPEVTAQDNTSAPIINLWDIAQQNKKRDITTPEGALEWNRNWINSPMHKEMLTAELQASEENDSAEDYARKRFENLEDITITTHNQRDQFRPGLDGKSGVLTGNIDLYPNRGGLIGIHEVSHSSDRRPRATDRERLIPSFSREKINEYRWNENLKGNSSDKLPPDMINSLEVAFSPEEILNIKKERKEAADYVTIPTETRARLNEIRAGAQKLGVYNPFTEKLSDSQMDQLIENHKSLQDKQSNNPYYELKQIYTEEEIKDMLNTISYENSSDNELPQARNGGPELQGGLREGLANKDFGIDLNALANTEAAVDNTKVDLFNPSMNERVNADAVRQENLRQLSKGTLSEVKDPTVLQKAEQGLNKLANPMATAGYALRGQDLPRKIQPGDNPFDMALDMVNPFAWANYGKDALVSASEGDVLGAAGNTLGAIPGIQIPGVTLGAKTLFNPVVKAGQRVASGKPIVPRQLPSYMTDIKSYSPNPNYKNEFGIENPEKLGLTRQAPDYVAPWNTKEFKENLLKIKGSEAVEQADDMVSLYRAQPKGFEYAEHPWIQNIKHRNAAWQEAMNNPRGKRLYGKTNEKEFSDDLFEGLLYEPSITDNYYGRWFAPDPEDLIVYLNKNARGPYGSEILEVKVPRGKALQMRADKFGKTASQAEAQEYILPHDFIKSATKYDAEELENLLKRHSSSLEGVTEGQRRMTRDNTWPEYKITVNKAEQGGKGVVSIPTDGAGISNVPLPESIQKVSDDLFSLLDTPEGKMRLKGNYGLTDNQIEQFFQTIEQSSTNTLGQFFETGVLSVNPNLPEDVIKKIWRHEIEHAAQFAKGNKYARPVSDMYIDQLKLVDPEIPAGYVPADVIKKGKEVDVSNWKEIFTDLPSAREYIKKPGEAGAFAAEIKQFMLDKGLAKSSFDKFTPEMVEQAHKMYNADKSVPLRLFELLDPKASKGNYTKMARAFNKMMALTGTVAAAEATKPNAGRRKPVKMDASGNTYKEGGVEMYQNGGETDPTDPNSKYKLTEEHIKRLDQYFIDNPDPKKQEQWEWYKKKSKDFTWNTDYDDTNILTVSDPNDPRLKGYQDSLYNYNVGKRLEEVMAPISAAETHDNFGDPVFWDRVTGKATTPPYYRSHPNSYFSISQNMKAEKAKGLSDNVSGVTSFFTPNEEPKDQGLGDKALSSLDNKAKKSLREAYLAGKYPELDDVQNIMEEYQEKGHKGIEPVFYDHYTGNPDNMAKDLVTLRGYTDFFGLTDKRHAGTFTLPMWKKPVQKVELEDKESIPESDFVDPRQLEFMLNPKKEDSKQKATTKEPSVIRPTITKIVKDFSGNIISTEKGVSQKDANKKFNLKTQSWEDYQNGGMEQQRFSKESIAVMRALRANGVEVSFGSGGNEGYRDNSPDRNNPINVINTTDGRISMNNNNGTPIRGVKAVIGTDEYGNQQRMMPGGEYQYPGNQITEVPIKRHGGREIPEYMGGGITNTSATGGNFMTTGEMGTAMDVAAGVGNVTQALSSLGPDSTGVADVSGMGGMRQNAVEGTIGATVGSIPIVGQFYQIGAGLSSGFGAGSDALHKKGDTEGGEILSGIEGAINPAEMFGRNAELWEAGYLTDAEAAMSFIGGFSGFGGVSNVGIDRKVREIQGQKHAGALTRATGGMHIGGYPSAEEVNRFPRATGYPKPKLT